MLPQTLKVLDCCFDDAGDQLDREVPDGHCWNGADAPAHEGGLFGFDVTPHSPQAFPKQLMIM